MSSKPIEVIQQLYGAFDRRDVAQIFGLFSSDIEIVQSEEVPWGGVYRGHEEAREFFTKLTERINSTLEIERYIVAEDQVAVVGWTCGTVNATGAKYRVPIVHTWKVRDGKAVRVHFLIDNATMLAALNKGKS